jgi:hypothetical protein
MSVMRTSLIGGLVQTLARQPQPRRAARARSSRSAAASRATRGPRRAAGAHRRHRLRPVAPEQWAEKAARSISSTQGRRRDACGGRPLVFEAGAHPRAIRALRRHRRRDGSSGSWASSIPAGSRNTSFRPGACLRAATGALLAGSPRFPGCPACPSCAATSPASFPKHPRRGRAGGRPRRLPPGSASSRCSISTGERASRPAEKALRFV